MLAGCSTTLTLAPEAPHAPGPALAALPRFAEERDERLAARGAARPDRVVDATAPGAPASSPGLAAPVRLRSSERRIGLPAGRSVVEVEVAAGRLVSIAVFGPSDALLAFDVANAPFAGAVRAHGALDEDGVLPRVASFRTPLGADRISVIVDATQPVELARIEADPTAVAPPPPKALKLGQAEPRPLIGFPAPVSREDGYLLQSPGRYQFLRVDVAAALLAALRQTRVRFRRDPIAIADITQWDGVRPATDLGRPRHISHEGGRDVDIALPANDDSPSTVRAHCAGVLVESDVHGCAPGTARGVDALRLAYLLGLLVDGEPAEPGATPRDHVEKIFTDDVYVREIRKAAEVLRERRWIKDAGYAALSEDGLLRPSPWHTDHVHVRFVGEPGRPLW